MERICLCGAKVILPTNVKGSNIKEVKCPKCGATAPLKIKKRNRNIKGLKQGFTYLHIRLRE